MYIVNIILQKVHALWKKLNVYNFISYNLILILLLKLSHNFLFFK